MLRPVFRAGDSYGVPPDIARDAGLAYWMAPAHLVFLAETDGVAVGTVYLRANGWGPADHVANAAFAVDPSRRGGGVATTLLDHVLRAARRAGFRAMQFNFVVASNKGAIALWQRHGFAVVGRLPGAFRHPRDGAVDALIMHRAI